MMRVDGYQQPGTTVVVVQQNQPWHRGPTYMRHGIQLGGIVMSFPIVVALGVLGGFLILVGIVMIVTIDNVFMGAILLVFGVLLIAGSVMLARHAKKKYSQHWSGQVDNPGRVINRNPGASPQQQPLNQQQQLFNPQQQPTGAAPYGMNPGNQMPTYPPGGYAQPPVGSYPPSPGGQPLNYPPPTSSAGAYPPYPSPQCTDMKVYPPPTMPGHSAPELQVPPACETAGNPNSPIAPEYGAPPPYAPDYKPQY